ncbi:hypothetical protein HHL24_35930 [Paraburkholderia sp. RP-4-7]|uniref:Uncharacterized protein n=1 Tax=Paraburkholderia polaris TaxID=2728848 RepID=A0A848ITG0_9BURK|nr:hypothetical protein [Paraburkholderia polaris]NMM03275.1 hypothetical protein [Paraburkholderia polaris]
MRRQSANYGRSIRSSGGHSNVGIMRVTSPSPPLVCDSRSPRSHQTDAQARYALFQVPVVHRGILVSLFGLYRQRPAEETMMGYLQVVDAVNLSRLARDQGG